MSLFAPVERALNTLFPQHTFLDDHLYVTKSRDIAATYKLNGVDFECLTDEMLDSITRRVHGVLKGIDANFRIYQYVVKRKGCDVAYYRANELYQIELFWVLLYEKRTGALAAHSIVDQLSAVRPLLATFETLMSSIARVQRADYPATFAFLQELTQSSGDLKYADHLDYWIAQKPITISHKRIYVGNRQVTPLTLTRLPPSTEPNMLSQLLRLPCELIVCSEFKKKAHDKASRIVHNSKKHNRSKEQNPDSSPTALARAGREEARKNQGSGLKDEAASENLLFLGDAVRRLSNHEFLGEFSLRVMLLDAPECATDVINIAVNQGAEMAVDTYGALDSFLSIMPGNTKRNIRKHWILSENYADMAMAFGTPVGDAINRHLGKEALCTFETTFKTPYAFNLYEDDLLTVLIFGVMGAGKSFLTNKLIADSQKYAPFTFILDIGNSYRQITEEYRGEYLELGKWKEGFAPFSLERTPVNLEFLSTLVHSLLEVAGYHPSPRESRLIDLAVRTAESLSDLDLPLELKDGLYNWTEGRYAHLFNNRREGISFADFQSIDFQGVRKQVMGPVFLYIFHLISLVVYDPKNLGRMKQVCADEPWKFVRDVPSGQDHLIEAGKTYRKHNGGIILTTQSALDYKGGFLDAIKEICTTRIFLANPGANRAFYQQSFDFNDRKVDLLMSLRKKEQFLLDTATRSAVLSFIATPEEISKFSNDPESNLRRMALVKESAA